MQHVTMNVSGEPKVVSLVGSWVWHIREKRLEVSDETYRIFGLDKMGIIGSLGQVLSEAIHPDDLAMVKAACSRVIREKRALPMECRVIWPDQTIRVVWLEVGELILDEKENPAIITGTMQDITDRQKTEAALSESEQRYRSLVDNIGLGVVLIGSDYRIRSVNPAYVSVFGRACCEDFIGKFCYQVHQQRQSPCPQCQGRRAMETGLPVEVEKGYVLAGGRHRQARVQAFPLMDSSGKPNAFIEVVEDITERRQAAEALRKSEEKFSKAFRLSPDAININRIGDGVFIDTNEGFSHIMGYTRQETIGRTSLPGGLDLWVNPQVRAQLAEDLKLKGEVVGLEADFRRKDGSMVIGLMSAKVIEIEGLPCILSITRDITEHRQLESRYLQAQKMEAVGRLAAGVAHDFNNQLTVIQGYSEMLLNERREGDPLWEPLAQIRQAARRAQSTTSHLLSFSRRQILEGEVIDLDAFLREIEKPISRMIGEDIRLIVATAPDAPAVFIDKSGLHQVVMNLVVNARDAMPNGGELVLQTSSLHLTAAAAAEYNDVSPGEYVLLEVIDSGSGMDRSTLEHAFEPFFTTKERGKGTGLGLPMVMGFMKQSNGSIAIRSEPGEGTTIRLLLPPARKKVDADQKPRRKASIDSATRKTIMVVEDEDGVRMFIAQALEQAGYRVMAASGPAEALKLSQEYDGRIAMLICDIVMPDMRGDELARILKASRRCLRVLLVTGYAEECTNRESEILRKPFEIDELLVRVQSLFCRQRPGRALKQ